MQDKNRNGTQDPMAQLDAAMDETFAELSQSGRGTGDREVVRDQPARRRAPRREEAPPAAQEDAPWFQEEAPPRQDRERPARRRRAAEAGDGPDPAAAILDEVESDDDTDARSARRARPQRDENGRFLPSRADTDAGDEDDSDEDDEEEEVPTRAGGRRAAETEEADVEDDDVESEGRTRAEDDEDEDQGERRGRRRFPRAVRQEIDRRVKEQVAKVVAENDTLREQQRAQQTTDTEAMQFLVKAVGTKEQRDELQATVNNTRLTLQQRNQAAAVLNRYLSNEQYARTYGTALRSMNRQELTKKRQSGVETLAKYRINLDPAVVHGEDESAMLVHVADAAIKAYRAQRAANNEQKRRQSATKRGMADERAVRNGSFARDSLASSNGRRANGRVASADPLRRAMGNTRGVAANSTLPSPTDQVLQQLRNGDITFADLGFGR